ncbi:MAG: hypothetical protein M1828_003654 [Chrysothrix sp. TS-e1954]|nr:MAG: hypothetical protein M1828_003654 [Chrysothrix sp. TS-e1954]
MSTAAAMPEGRIPELAFKVVTGLAFGLAMLAAVVRGAIRVKTRKMPSLDDYILLFACACLIGSTGVLYYGLPYIYFSEALTLSASGGAQSAAAGLDYTEINAILAKLVLFQKVNWAYLAVSWTAIFSVKFAFLAFFRKLVDRLPRLLLFWKILVGFTSLVFCFAVCDSFIACPKTGLASLSCSQGQGVVRALALGSTAISLDIVTDMLILAIPISLLWKVQMKPRQKLGLAAFLCLSVFMVVVAAIRVSGFHYKGTWDNTWIFFWQQIEACTAVSMISVTAFRSAFVADGSKPGRKKYSSPKHASPREPSMVQKVLGKHEKTPSDQGDLANLTIPRATMTGARTAIRGETSFLDTERTGEDTLVGDYWSTRSVSEHEKVYLSDGSSQV